jgi:hypothetical protein
LPTQEEAPHSLGAIKALRRFIYFLVVALLLGLALFKFVFEDALRLAYPFNDLTTPWVTTRAFLDGKNPYNDINEFDRIWAATGIPLPASCADYRCILAIYQPTYPPPALELIAPLGWLSWHAAVRAYTAVSSILFVLMLLLLAHQLPLPWRDLRKLYFVAFALAMAPLHSGIHEANLSTLVVAFLCAGVGLLSKRPYGAGIAIAIAMCLKPQVAVFFFAYPWLRKKWKTAMTSLVACGAFFLSSLAWMKMHHVEWFGAFLSQLSQFSAPGGRSSAEAPGPGKFQLLNLQILTYQLTRSREGSAILAWAIFAPLACAAVYLILRHVSDENESAGIAMVAVLTLLPVYQRFYAAEILLFVVYWAVENGNLRGAKAALLIMIPLLFPFAAMAERTGIAARWIGGHPSALSFLWNDLLLPHVIWIELLLLLILIADLSRRSARLPARGILPQAAK